MAWRKVQQPKQPEPEPEPEPGLTWTNDFAAGHSEAELGGLRLRISKLEGVWTAEIYQGETLLASFHGARSIRECSLVAAMFAVGWLEAKEDQGDVECDDD